MKRVVAGVVLLFSAVLVGGPAVEAEAPEATAWWWRATPNATALPASPPTPVEPGGLYVAGEPTGPAGLSALRLTLADNQAASELVLVIDTDERTGVPKAQGDLKLIACPAARVWAPEEGGPIERAPACDPAGLAFGSVVGDKVRFPVGGLVRNGALNIVIKPADGAVFQVAFDKPGADAIQVTTYASEGDGGGPEGYQDFVGFDFGPAFDVPAAPSTPSLVGDLPVQAPPAALAPTAPASGPSQTIPASSFPRARQAKEARTPQVVAAMVLVGLILVYLGLLQAPGHMPQLLGPFRRESVAPAVAPPVDVGELPRGIGRFARPRIGPAPKL